MSSKDFPDLHFLMSDAEQESEKCRKMGNEMFENEQYYEALICYNKSLACAKRGSEKLGLGFANRAAVYLKLNLFDHCLTNLKLAEDNKYPRNKMDKLKIREQKCREELKVQKSDPTKDFQSMTEKFFKLSHKPSKKHASIAGCIFLQKDPKYGTKIVTNKSLEVGDIIAIENPHCGALQIDSCFSRCATCFKENFLNLLPCSGCRCLMFCSEQCKRTAHDRFHRYQCEEMDTFGLSRYSMWASVAFKQFIESTCALNKNIVRKFSRFEMSDDDIDFDFDQPRNLFTVELGKDKAVNEKKMISVAAQLESKLKYKGFTDIKTIFSTCCAQFPKTVVMLCCADCKTLGLKIFTKCQENIFTKKFTRAGHSYWFGALYFLRGYMNHSCVPNVSTKFIDGGKMVYIVTAPVPAGAELFINHVRNLTSIPVPKRQQKMFDKFNFKCECDECSSYSEGTTKPAEIALPPEEARSLSTSKSIENYRKNCRFIQKNIGKASSHEIACLREANKIYLKNISTPEAFRKCKD